MRIALDGGGDLFNVCDEDDFVLDRSGEAENRCSGRLVFFTIGPNTPADLLVELQEANLQAMIEASAF